MGQAKTDKKGRRGWKRPCSQCRRWFTPDPRTRKTQKTCGEAACRQAQKRRTDRAWRRRNPDYFVARRLIARAEVLEKGAADDRRLRGPPAQLMRLPLDFVQEALGSQGVAVIEFFGRVLHRSAQEAIGEQAPVMAEKIARVMGSQPQEAIEGRGPPG